MSSARFDIRFWLIALVAAAFLFVITRPAPKPRSLADFRPSANTPALLPVQRELIPLEATPSAPQINPAASEENIASEPPANREPPAVPPEELPQSLPSSASIPSSAFSHLPAVSNVSSDESETEATEQTSDLSDDHGSTNPLDIVPVVIERLPSTDEPLGLDADEAKIIDQLARKHVERGFSLGDRNATFAARQEFLKALRVVGQAVDAKRAGFTSSDTCSLALNRALEALREVGDFSPNNGREVDLPHVLRAHRTPISKSGAFSTALAAQQAYYNYAGEQLAIAAAGNRMASHALTGLGKCCLAEPEAGSETARSAKAMVYYQAALAADGSNHLAANELGVLLGKFGQWKVAKRVFLQAVRQHNDPASWQNLATVHSQLGEMELSKLAIEESQRLQATGGLPNVSSAVDGTPAVQWVDPRAFGGPGDDSQLSPRVDGALSAQKKSTAAGKLSSPTWR